MKTNAHGYQAGMTCACGTKIVQLPATLNTGERVEYLACPADGKRYGRAL